MSLERPNSIANVLSRRCPSNQVLDMVADKWSVLVIYTLKRGTLRHGELFHLIEGISQKMLTQTLRNLQKNGLITRKVYAAVPPHTEYTLTPLGYSLHEVLAPLCRWAEHNWASVVEARELYVLEGDGSPT
ncbi:helix-turn-helix domain-containing protein [Meiothermus sp.]|uniref:winged helix-turn-helix transcriptional regulator n=1 Tax=Meiothermus sp. TaxID=1955249 RepID=UPI00260EC59D|nr:helix-turn-helix domain-containing protein [Meiothermus sp.]